MSTSSMHSDICMCSTRLKPSGEQQSTSLSAVLLTQNPRQTRTLSRIDWCKSRKREGCQLDEVLAPAGISSLCSGCGIALRCDTLNWFSLYIYFPSPALSREIMVHCWWYSMFISISRPADSTWWVCNVVFLIRHMLLAFTSPALLTLCSVVFWKCTPPVSPLYFLILSYSFYSLIILFYYYFFTIIYFNTWYLFAVAVTQKCLRCDTDKGFLILILFVLLAFSEQPNTFKTSNISNIYAHIG